MLTVRSSQDRGHADHGWLNATHTFSFANYYDPQFMGFRSLRVINQDRISGGSGFPKHPHRDMEIITYMIGGALKHKDSQGNEGEIKRGDIQYMSAGPGIMHSEFNASADEEAQLLQIWIEPPAQGLPAKYEQKSFLKKLQSGKLTLLLSPEGEDESLPIFQDAKLWSGWMEAQTINLPLKKDRHGWLQIVSGEMTLNGQELKSGDGVAIAYEENPELKLKTKSEFLFFDLS